MHDLYNYKYGDAEYTKEEVRRSDKNAPTNTRHKQVKPTNQSGITDVTHLKN